MSFQIIQVTETEGRVIAPEWLLKSESIHRQLRPHLTAYVATMDRVFADGGRMAIAIKDGLVAGIAVYRVYENTALGRHMYVDDLVTDEAQRSLGAGRFLVSYLSSLAKEFGCKKLTLDSGTHRQQAHKFYFREQFLITAFHFQKELNQPA